ncbi:MAG: hypothetical protein MRJ52_09545 [Nitrosomonas sp.]|nr:hypothetical protein [Nitrosomonas sp.]
MEGLEAYPYKELGHKEGMASDYDNLEMCIERAANSMRPSNYQKALAIDIELDHKEAYGHNLQQPWERDRMRGDFAFALMADFLMLNV